MTLVTSSSMSIHPSSITALSLLWGRRVFCCSQSQLSLGEGRVLPGQVSMQGANLTSGEIWGSVSCSRTLQHTAQLSPELGFEPATFQSLAYLLYPLSYSQVQVCVNVNVLLQNCNEALPSASGHSFLQQVMLPSWVN